MRHPPQSARVTQVVRWHNGQQDRVLDELAAEEPLEIRVGGRPVTVTMRTPGNDFALAAGLLFTEGVLQGRGDIERIAYGTGDDGVTSGNVVEVSLAPGRTPDLERLARHFVAASSCGVCGKASIDSLRLRKIERPPNDVEFDPKVLSRLPDVLLPAQRIFNRTGGLHAAALFDADGTLLVLHEDIGRHNAVDKVIGHVLLENAWPPSRHILLVSGRNGFEIVQKALAAGLPVVASVSAPSSLAVQLAREFGLTLVGFLRNGRFTVYSGEARLTLAKHELGAPEP